MKTKTENSPTAGVTLEIAQLKLAMVRTDVAIAHMENAIEAMRQKQTDRVREIEIQEKLARRPAPSADVSTEGNDE